MRDFVKWFVSKGWRSYVVALIVIMAANYTLFNNFDELLINNSTIVVVLTCLTVFGADIGIIAHIIQKYKIRNK